MKLLSKKKITAGILVITGGCITLASFGVLEVLGVVALRLVGVSP